MVAQLKQNGSYFSIKARIQTSEHNTVFLTDFIRSKYTLVQVSGML